MEETDEDLRSFVPCTTLHTVSGRARDRGQGRRLAVTSEHQRQAWVLTGVAWCSVLTLGAGMGGAWYIQGGCRSTTCQVGSSARLLGATAANPHCGPRHSVGSTPCLLDAQESPSPHLLSWRAC